MRYLPGDIVGTWGPWKLSEGIRRWTRQKGEPPSVVNHTEVVVVGASDIREVETVAALLRSGVIQHRLGDAYGGTRNKVEVWRADNFDTTDRALIGMTAQHFIGQRYPCHRLVFQLVDEMIFGGRFIFRRLAIVPGLRICTPLVVEAIWPTGYHFGFKDPSQANPDSLRDFLEGDDHYRVIHPLQEIEPCQPP